MGQSWINPAVQRLDTVVLCRLDLAATFWEASHLTCVPVVRRLSAADAVVPGAFLCCGDIRGSKRGVPWGAFALYWETFSGEDARRRDKVETLEHVSASVTPFFVSVASDSFRQLAVS